MRRHATPSLFVPSRRKRRGGFTLIEVLVALVLVGAIVLIFGGSVIVADRAAHLNAQYAQAISIAQHKIDQMRAIGYGRVWDTVNDRPNYTEMNDAGIVDDSPTASPFSFKLSDEVQSYLPNATATIKVEKVTISSVTAVKATVTVIWTPKTHTPTNQSKLALTALLTNVE